MFGFGRVISWFGLFVVVACSDDDGGGGTSSGGSGTAGTGGVVGNGGAGTGGNGGGGSTCSPYPFDAPEVTGSRESGPPPTMTGGQVVDGKYWLTSMQNYGSRNPYTAADRLDIARGGTYYDEVQMQGGIEVRDGTSMQANGTSMTFTITCGQFVNTTGTAEYTATPTQFMILPPNGVLRTYTKQ